MLENLLAQLPSEGSRRVYRVAWVRYERWLSEHGIAALAARPRDVAAHLTYLRDEGKAKATIGHALSVIREVYGAHVREEEIAANPAREVKLPKLSGDPRTPWLTEEDARKLLSVPRETWKERRTYVVLSLLLGLGWRRAEVARMRVEDFKDGTVTGIVKGGKSLTVGVPAWVGREVDNWRTFAEIKKGPLIPRSLEDPRAVTGADVYYMVRQAARLVGLRVSPHALRRTNITLTGERGVSLKARQLAVGHTSQATTERYDRAREAAQNAPGEVLGDLLKRESE